MQGASNYSRRKTECLEEVKLLNFNRYGRGLFTFLFTSDVSFICWKIWQQISFYGVKRIFGKSKKMDLKHSVLLFIVWGFEENWWLAWSGSMTDCSLSSIYFDYRPPSECWPSPLQAGNGKGMGNRNSLVAFPLLFWKAISSAYVRCNQQAWLAEQDLD